MNLIFLILTSALLLSRLPYIYSSEKITLWQILFLLLPQASILSLVFRINCLWFIFAGISILINVGALLWDFLAKGSRSRKTGRLMVLIAHILSYSIFSSPGLTLIINTSKITHIRIFIEKYISIFSIQTDLLSWLYILTGILVLFAETNLVIQYITEKFNKEVKSSGLEISSSGESFDIGKYVKTGRLIGIIERMIIYLSILGGIPILAGFVVTAKGIIRYKEIDDKNNNSVSVELVLVGTLLSVSIAVLIVSWFSVKWKKDH